MNQNNEQNDVITDKKWVTISLLNTEEECEFNLVSCGYSREEVEKKANSRNKDSLPIFIYYLDDRIRFCDMFAIFLAENDIVGTDIIHLIGGFNVWLDNEIRQHLLGKK